MLDQNWERRPHQVTEFYLFKIQLLGVEKNVQRPVKNGYLLEVHGSIYERRSPNERDFDAFGTKERIVITIVTV